MGIGGCIPGNIKSSVQIQKELNRRYGKREYVLVGKYRGYQHKHSFLHKCGATLKCTVDALRSKRCSCLHAKQMHRTLEIHKQEVQEWRGSEYDCLKFNKNRCKPNTYI